MRTYTRVTSKMRVTKIQMIGTEAAVRDRQRPGTTIKFRFL